MDYTAFTLILGCLLCCLLFRTSSHWPWDPLVLSQTLPPLFPVSSNLLLLLDYFLFYYNTAWPHYKLDNHSQWLENGILDFKFSLTLMASAKALANGPTPPKLTIIWSHSGTSPTKSSDTTNAPPQSPSPPTPSQVCSPISPFLCLPQPHPPQALSTLLPSAPQAPKAVLTRSSIDGFYLLREVVSGASLFSLVRKHLGSF